MARRAKPRRGRFSVAAGRVLTGSARLIKAVANTQGPQQAVQPWQLRAYAFYDALGEVWYAAQFYSRSLGKLRLYIGEYDDKGEIKEVADASIQAYVDRLTEQRDTQGGAALLSNYGRLRFLAGECYLLLTFDDSGNEEWEVVSNEELKVQGSGEYDRRRAPGAPLEKLRDISGDASRAGTKGDALVYRLWRPHPRYSDWADSPMKAVLDLCEELLLLQLAVRARARSRAAGAGILLIPDDGFIPPADENANDDDPQNDPFMERLTSAMVNPLADEGVASSVVPMIVRWNAETIDRWRHIDLSDPSKTYPEKDLRMEAIQRIALGLDLPPEELTGKGGANHWSAWQISEDAWKAHVEPVAIEMVNDFTSSYLLPTLEAEGVQDPERYLVWFDAAAVVVSPDRTTDAKDLHDRLAISDQSLRDAAGFDETDKPEDQELNRRIGVQLNNADLAITGELAATLPQPPPGQAPPPPPVGDGGSPSNAPKAPPDQQQPSGGGNGAAPTPTQAAVIRAAGDLIVASARSKAGARIRTTIRKDARLAQEVASVSNEQLAARLTYLPDGLKANELTRGTGECFHRQLAEWGLPDWMIARLLIEAEEHAANTLLDSAPAPLQSLLHGFATSVLNDAEQQ